MPQPCRATAQHRAELMLEMGCDIVDIGGQSTRPGAEEVSEAQELDRVVPLIEYAPSAAKSITDVMSSCRAARVLCARELALW